MNSDPKAASTDSSSTIIARMIRQIRSGALAPHTRLPSYPNLAAQWGVGRTTAARIIRVLREAGYVEGVPGRATYVAQELPPEQAES